MFFLHLLAVWHSGSIICHINKVAPCRAHLVLKWVTTSGGGIISAFNQTRSTQTSIPPGSWNRVPALFGWWQVTLCDPIQHVSSDSGDASCDNSQTAISCLHIFTLLVQNLCSLWRSPEFQDYVDTLISKWVTATKWCQKLHLSCSRCTNSKLSTSLHSCAASLNRTERRTDCIVTWPTTSCFADWSKCRHVTSSIIECPPRHGRPSDSSMSDVRHWTVWRSCDVH